MICNACAHVCCRSRTKGERVEEDGLAVQDALTPAAVLVPIVLHQDQPSVLLTQRTRHLRDHAGQISFPAAGSRVMIEVWLMLLREAEEEGGLPPEHVEGGWFPSQYRTGTGFSVTPVVAFVAAVSTCQDPFGRRSLRVPLALSAGSANHQQHEGALAGPRTPVSCHSLWVIVSSGGNCRDVDLAVQSFLDIARRNLSSFRNG